MKIILPKPRLLVSQCLLGEACRYDGAILNYPWLKPLLEYCEVEVYCPEMAAQMGHPRPPLHLVERDQGLALLQENNPQDLRPSLTRTVIRDLLQMPAVQGLLLKSQSPSCALHDAKLYQEDWNGPLIGTMAGVFAIEARRRYPEAPAIDEKLILEPFSRFSFLAKAHLLALVGQTQDLQETHHQLSMFLMGLAPSAFLMLEGLVGEPNLYFRELTKVLKKPFTKASHERALAFGLALAQERGAGLPASFVKKVTSFAGHFEELIEIQKAALEVLPETSPIFQQFYFQPFPKQLWEALEEAQP